MLVTLEQAIILYQKYNNPKILEKIGYQIDIIKMFRDSLIQRFEHCVDYS